MRLAILLLVLSGCAGAQPSRHFRFRLAEDFQEITLDGRTRAQMAPRYPHQLKK